MYIIILNDIIKDVLAKYIAEQYYQPVRNHCLNRELHLQPRYLVYASWQHWKWDYSLLFFFFSVPPGRPIIYNERGIIVENNLGPYNEGVELILTCSVSGGKSDYIFLWLFIWKREKKFVLLCPRKTANFHMAKCSSIICFLTT